LHSIAITTPSANQALYQISHWPRLVFNSSPRKPRFRIRRREV